MCMKNFSKAVGIGGVKVQQLAIVTPTLMFTHNVNILTVLQYCIFKLLPVCEWMMPCILYTVGHAVVI